MALMPSRKALLKGPHSYMRKLSLILGLIAPLALAGLAPAEASLDPKAVEVLKGMGDYLGSLPSLTLEVADSVDKRDEQGRMLTFHHQRTIELRRPDRLRVTVTGDLENDHLIYDGKLVTLVLGNDDLYAQADAAPTVEGTLDLLREKYGIRRPLMELLRHDVSARVVPQLKQVSYIGLAKIGGVECHHIAFNAVEGVEWQLWVENDATPAPAKIVVHYSQFPGEPRYIVQSIKLNPNTTHADSLFQFSPAEGVEKVPFELSEDVGGQE